MRGTIRRRRVLAVGAVALGVIALGALLSRGGDSGPKGTTAKAAAPVQLPRGGRTLLPRTRVVAFYGAPQDTELGALGIGSPAHAARRLERVAAPYRHLGRPVVPAMELLADVANAAPGRDGLYMSRQTDGVIRPHLDAPPPAQQPPILHLPP